MFVSSPCIYRGRNTKTESLVLQIFSIPHDHWFSVSHGAHELASSVSLCAMAAAWEQLGALSCISMMMLQRYFCCSDSEQPLADTIHGREALASLI